MTHRWKEEKLGVNVCVCGCRMALVKGKKVYFRDGEVSKEPGQCSRPLTHGSKWYQSHKFQIAVCRNEK